MRHCLFAAALTLGLLAAGSAQATPAPFTPGDLAVYRVGNGSQNQVGTGNTVFLDEYSPTGTLVQSYQFSDSTANGAAALTAQGNATADGFLTRSANGAYLNVPGYNASLGAVVTGTTNSSPRMIARVAPNGNLDLSTSITNLGADGSGGFRGAVSNDGSQFWMITQSKGVYTVPLGGSTATQVSTDFTGRTINIYGGQLYATGSTNGVSSIGTGLPTTSGQSVNNLVGAVGAYNFYFADLSSAVAGLDTLYYADDGANQVKKFSLVGGSWVQTGAITTGGAAKGLTGQTNGTAVSLYISAGAAASMGTGSIAFFTDATGYNGTVTGTETPIVSVTTRKFQGISFVPAAQMSISATAGPTPRGVATKDVVADLGAAQPVGFNNGQVQVLGLAPTDTSFGVALDIERGDAATSGATPTAAEIATLVAHLNDPGSQLFGSYVAADLVNNPGSASGVVPDGDFEVFLTFTGANPAAAQYLNFDMLQDTGLDIDRLFVTAVPEPASMGTMLLAAVGLLSRRRKHAAA